jgi:hypothetical protein
MRFSERGAAQFGTEPDTDSGKLRCVMRSGLGRSRAAAMSVQASPDPTSAHEPSDAAKGSVAAVLSAAATAEPSDAAKGRADQTGTTGAIRC